MGGLLQPVGNGPNHNIAAQPWRVGPKESPPFLDQNDFEATNGPEIGARVAASPPDSTSQVSDRLAVLAELSLTDLRLPLRDARAVQRHRNAARRGLRLGL